MRELFYWILLFVMIGVGACHGLEEREATEKSMSNQRQITQSISYPETSDLLDKYTRINRLFDSLEYFERLSKAESIKRVKLNLGQVLRNSGNYFESIRFFDEALAVALDSTVDLCAGKIHKGLAGNYYELFFHNKEHRDYLDSSAKYASKSLQIARQINDATLKSQALNILGGIQIHRGSYDSALVILAQAYQQSLVNSAKAPSALLNNLAFTHNKLGDYEEALQYANACFAEAAGEGDLVFSAIAQETMANIYEARGDTAQAEQIKGKVKEIKSKKDVVAQSFMVKQLLLDYENRQASKALLGLSNDRIYFVRLSRILIAFSIVLIIILIFSIYSIKQNKRLRQADLELHQAQKLSDRLKIENTELELRAREAEAKTMKTDLENKDHKLASKLLSLSQLNAFLLNLKNTIHEKPASANGKWAGKKLTEVDLEISKYLNNNIWEEFELLYASGNNNFIRELSQSHPDLTINEKRLSYLMLMDLSSKEISQVLNKSYRSVEMARHRLRNKLGIERNHNLSQYLKEFVQ